MAEKIEKEINSGSPEFRLPKDIELNCNFWEPIYEGKRPPKIILAPNTRIFSNSPDEEGGNYIAVKVMGIKKIGVDGEELKREKDLLMCDKGEKLRIDGFKEIYIKVNENIKLQLGEIKKLEKDEKKFEVVGHMEEEKLEEKIDEAKMEKQIKEAEWLRKHGGGYLSNPEEAQLRKEKRLEEKRLEEKDNAEKEKRIEQAKKLEQKGGYLFDPDDEKGRIYLERKKIS